MKQRSPVGLLSTAVVLMTSALCMAAMPEAAPALDAGGLTAITLKPFEERNPQPADVAVAVWPTSMLDAQNTHHLSQNQPTIMILPLANPQARQLSEARIVVDLPAGVELFWSNAYLNWDKLESTSIEHNSQPYTRYLLPCTVHPTTFPNTQGGSLQGFVFKRPPALWLKSSAAPGDSLNDVYLQVQYKERAANSLPDVETTWQESAVTQIQLKVDASARTAQPQQVKSGVMGRFILNGGRQPDNAQAIHEWLTELGYNFVIRGVPTAPAIDNLAIWQETRIQNAYRTGGDVPQDAAFIVNGKALPGVVTPAAIYRKDAWVVQNVLSDLDKQAASGKLGWQWTNLEPYVYLKNWDESDRNRDEFIQWSGLEAQTVKHAWPADVAKAFPQQWKQFQNWQVGQATRTLAEYIQTLGQHEGRELRLVYSTAQDAIAGEPGFSMDVAAWGDMPAVAQTWCFYHIPYLGKLNEDRLGSAAIGRARWLRLRAQEMFPQQHAFALSLIYGWDQTSAGFFFPEQLQFLHESSVFAGTNIVHNYAEFPIWDARYATAMANANAQISRWESFIVHGQSVRTHTLISQNATDNVSSDKVTPQSQEVTDDVAVKGNLFSFEYALHDKTLIAIANTWTHREDFATLRVLHLDDNRKYQLSDPANHRILASTPDKDFITGKELRQGLLIHLPALRWTCLLLEPYAPQTHNQQSTRTILAANQLLPLVPAWKARFEAKLDQQKIIAQENFDSLPLGIQGQGKHGERLAQTILNIGYPNTTDLAQNFVQIVAQDDQPKNHALELVRNNPQNNLYVAARAVHQEGSVNFNLTPIKTGPFRITLSAYLAELRVLNEPQWTTYFGDQPYQSNFVYIEGDGTPQGKGIDTGITATTGTTYNITLAWTPDRKCTVTIDGQKVIDNLSFKVTKYNIESIVWGLDPGMIQGNAISAMRVDDIRIFKP